METIFRAIYYWLFSELREHFGKDAQPMLCHREPCFPRCMPCMLCTDSGAVLEQTASFWTRPRIPLIVMWFQLSTSAVAPPPCESELPKPDVSCIRWVMAKAD